MSPKRYTPYEVPEGTRPDPKEYDSKLYQKEDTKESEDKGIEDDVF